MQRPHQCTGSILATRPPDLRSSPSQLSKVGHKTGYMTEKAKVKGHLTIALERTDVVNRNYHIQDGCRKLRFEFCLPFSYKR